MDFGRGEGELGIENQGRFGTKISNSFSQETEAIGQQTPRIGDERPKLRFTQRVSSAGCARTSDSTPHFFSPERSAEEQALKVVNQKLQNCFRNLFASSKGDV
jgi:hypothetical protein